MVFIPLYDEAPAKRESPPYVTYGMIALNTLVLLYTLGLPSYELERIYQIYGLTPAAFTGPESFFGSYGRYITFVSYQFLHGGVLHFAGNMLFLWIFGDNVEDAFGHSRFLAFYLLSGIAGGIVYVLSAPDSTVLMVGASGATAGVLAAYLMLRPCAKVEVWCYVWPVKLAAYWVIGIWIATQFWNVLTHDASEVAWWCHIGGLAAGALLTFVARQPGVVLFECMRPALTTVEVKPPVPTPPAEQPAGKT